MYVNIVILSLINIKLIRLINQLNIYYNEMWDSPLSDVPSPAKSCRKQLHQ